MNAMCIYIIKYLLKKQPLLLVFLYSKELRDYYLDKYRKNT
jgi:hypothetical protein